MSEIELPKVPVHNPLGLTVNPNSIPPKPAKTKSSNKTQKGKLSDSRIPDVKIDAEPLEIGDVNSPSVDAVVEYKMAETAAVLRAGVNMHNQMIRITKKKVQMDQENYRNQVRRGIQSGLEEIGMTWEEVEELFADLGE